MLTAGVAGMTEKGIATLQAALQQTGLVESVVPWDLQGEPQISNSAALPDVVLVELEREHEIPLAFAAQVQRLRPSAWVIACSTLQQPTHHLLMQAMRSGVREFLTQPIDLVALREILQRVIREQGLTESGTERLILLVGAKGGVGTTTVAVNLAVQLAQVSKRKVALMDLARPIGHVSLLLDLQPRFSVRDAVDNLDRLDTHFLGGLMAAHSSGLHVLSGVADPDGWQRITVGSLARVMNVVQGSFEHVVADCGSIYTSDWSQIFRMARMVILVADVLVPALWALERHLSTMTSLGLDPDRLRVVINRWHRTDEEALKAFEKRVKRPVFARLPNDYRQVSESVNLGAALSRNHNDPLVSKLQGLAANFAGVHQQPEDSKRGSLFSLFSSPGKR
jgi:pilus assembly protein CpaE